MKRDIQKVKDDVIEMKRLIKQTLIADTDILEALHSEIDIDSPDEFLDTHIFEYLRIPTTQDAVRNFICFTVDDMEEHRFNEAIKVQFIQFTVICHLDDMKTEYGMGRHDLLGYLVRDIFNWTNIFGLQFKLVGNKESPTDSDYYCRTLQFKAEKPNMLNRARMDNLYDKVGR